MPDTGDPIPARRELMRLVRSGVPHAAIRDEAETEGNRAALLRALATVPLRRGSWWEALLWGALAGFWTLYLLIYSLGTFTDLESVGAGLFAWILGLLFTVQVWRRNGAMYFAGALWLCAGLFIDWWEYWAALDTGGELYGLTYDGMLWITWITLGAAAGMVLLWKRLFHHVRPWGQHRESAEQRIIQF